MVRIFLDFADMSFSGLLVGTSYDRSIGDSNMWGGANRRCDRRHRNALFIGATPRRTPARGRGYCPFHARALHHRTAPNLWLIQRWGVQMEKSLKPDNLLAALPAELSRGLFAKARTVSLAAGQMLFLAGDEGDGCYRVEDGLLKANVVAPAGGERILAILGPGSIVGELSMIDGAPRSASVSALRDSKLSFISRAVFDDFGRSDPQLYRHVM